METSLEQYKSLNIDGSLICLEWQDNVELYFCYPVGAKVIGFEGCIMYCLLPGYGEMVFSANPVSMGDNVYPLAKDFHDFMRLILACGSANPVEQVVWMSREQFAEHVQEQLAAQTGEQKAVLATLREALGLTPMEHPYEYVREMQKDFDASKIQYCNDYYDTLGLERPDRTKHETEPYCEVVTFLFDGSEKNK